MGPRETCREALRSLMISRNWSGRTMAQRGSGRSGRKAMVATGPAALGADPGRLLHRGPVASSAAIDGDGGGAGVEGSATPHARDAASWVIPIPAGRRAPAWIPAGKAGAGEANATPRARDRRHPRNSLRAARVIP